MWNALKSTFGLSRPKPDVLIAGDHSEPTSFNQATNPEPKRQAHAQAIQTEQRDLLQAKSQRLQQYVLDQTVPDKASLDRILMPPPFGSPSLNRRHNRTASRPSMAASDVDNRSQTTTTRGAENLSPDDYAMERARRHAAAIHLPPNSGSWTPVEEDLYYHLALRGFEPLVPHNWMLDFKTFPLTIFSDKDSDIQPLITNLHHSEFRAIHALEELLKMGVQMRDKHLLLDDKSRFSPEPVLKRAITKYIDWAIKDAGVEADEDTVPMHVVYSRRGRRNGRQTIEHMSSKLRALGAKHRDRLQQSFIQQSIESDDPLATPKHMDGEDLADDRRAAPNLATRDATTPPILHGIMIFFTFVILFTFDPANDQLRWIAKFDFARKEYDVWNALAVAITALSIRNVILDELARYGGDTGSEGDEDEAALDSVKAKRKDKTEEWRGKKRASASDNGRDEKKRRVLSEDPDL